MFFDDVLSHIDFDQAIGKIIPEFRGRYELPEIYQLGLVVRDVETAAISLEEQGLAPFFIAAGAPAFWLEREQKRDFKGKLGLSHYHGVEVELLEPGEGSDFYRRSLDKDDRVIVQHLGFLVDDVDAWVSKFSSEGFSTWVRGSNQIGPARTQFAYMDTVDEAGLIIEFFSRRTFGINCWPLGSVFRLIARVQKITGKRSLSL